MFNEKVPLHISLIAKDTMNYELFESSLANYIQQIKPFNVKFASFGYFPSTNVAFLNPKESETLRALQIQIYNIIIDSDPSLNSSDFVSYNPDAWIPHSTLAMNIKYKNIQKVFDITQDILNLQIDKPFIAKTNRIALFSYPPFKILKTMSFSTD